MHERGRKETTIKNYKYTTSYVRKRYMLWKKEKKRECGKGISSEEGWGGDELHYKRYSTDNVSLPEEVISEQR